MLDLVNKTLNKLFGNKSDKDIKALTPNVELINEHFAQYAPLSNDELRGKTLSFKDRINQATKELQDQISALRKGLEDDSKEIYEKEEIYEQIDKLEKSDSVEDEEEKVKNEEVKQFQSEKSKFK